MGCSGASNNCLLLKHSNGACACPDLPSNSYCLVHYVLAYLLLESRGWEAPEWSISTAN